MIRYRIKKAAAAFVALAVIACFAPRSAAAGRLSIEEFGAQGLGAFLAASDEDAPVELLVGVWLYEGRDIAEPDGATLATIASILRTRSGWDEYSQLWAYCPDHDAVLGMMEQTSRMRDILCVLDGKRFPLDEDSGYAYEDTWCSPRQYGGERSHEGTDIICRAGEPVRSVGEGVVEKVGWNTLGGWRAGIRGVDGVYYYYAHMSAYITGLTEGTSISAGQVIGYVGSTGYGDVGTSDMMIPHLHFGMYLGRGDDALRAVNPYPFLAYWEGK